MNLTEFDGALSTNYVPANFSIHNNAPINADSERNNDEAVVSVEMKVDSKDLVSILDGPCQVDASALSQNFSENLNISEYTAEQSNRNMTDSLTKLANEAYDKFQH